MQNVLSDVFKEMQGKEGNYRWASKGSKHRAGKGRKYRASKQGSMGQTRQARQVSKGQGGDWTGFQENFLGLTS